MAVAGRRQSLPGGGDLYGGLGGKADSSAAPRHQVCLEVIQGRARPRGECVDVQPACVCDGNSRMHDACGSFTAT